MTFDDDGPSQTIEYLDVRAGVGMMTEIIDAGMVSDRAAANFRAEEERIDAALEADRQAVEGDRAQRLFMAKMRGEQVHDPSFVLENYRRYTEREERKQVKLEGEFGNPRDDYFEQRPAGQWLPKKPLHPEPPKSLATIKQENDAKTDVLKRQPVSKLDLLKALRPLKRKADKTARDLQMVEHAVVHNSFGDNPK